MHGRSRRRVAEQADVMQELVIRQDGELTAVEILKEVFDSEHNADLLGETQAMASTRNQRWALMLRAYIYKISYNPGLDHTNADCLSRLPVPTHVTTVPLPGERAPIQSG